MTVRMLVERLAHGEGLELPEYKTAGSSGMDLHAAVEEEETIEPGGIALVPTGLKMAIPEGYEAQVRARSGLAIKHGICVLNGPGTVDSDYRGEVKVILANLGKEEFAVKRGDRIAQMVIMRVEKARIEEVDEVPETVRGEGGFGSSGR
ncbi:MAG: dUTP diphosphatase [Planctomycetes bacterium]|nr:dUTP diphosphatase [Planctomycetota bacterium]